MSHELLGEFLSYLVCRVVYIEGIKYVSLIEIGPVVIEIQGVENGKVAVPVNNTPVCQTAFLAANTQPCVLICVLLPVYFHVPLLVLCFPL